MADSCLKSINTHSFQVATEFYFILKLADTSPFSSQLNIQCTWYLKQIWIYFSPRSPSQFFSYTGQIV